MKQKMKIRKLKWFEREETTKVHLKWIRKKKQAKHA